MGGLLCSQYKGVIFLEQLEIRQMEERDLETINQVFSEHKINKSVQYLARCWKENLTGERITLVALHEGKFIGSLHLLDKPDYPYFRENGIPEVNDFNVIPPYQKKGIGTLLMDAIEKMLLINTV